MNNSLTRRYCGRDFTFKEIEDIRRIIVENPNNTRASISRIVCQNLTWYKSDGGLKEMSCRVALLRMQKDDLITLPLPRHLHKNSHLNIKITDATNPKPPILSSVNNLLNLDLQLVISKEQSSLWREFIHRYHYLGYSPLPGAQLRYFILSNEEILALLGFGAAAWKIAPRDNFIGWSHEQRKKRLHLIVNNARFLILPWVYSKNLASKVLAMVAKRLTHDWNTRYGYSPVLLETFVESNRFYGTCYKAANWIHVGQTKGRGKLDVHNTALLPKKDIFLYLLTPKAKNILSFF
jgi:hypothetical protein